ncbi:response regulator transcription factor [Heyndrickxia oleronia]|uniref:LytR/AlgR family response regulator transcription factor n=1 Tax=Heyndrickxia oleronia TaxID=38875 RepID=UPI00333DC504
MIKIGLVDDQAYDLEKLQTILEKEEEIEIVFATNNSEHAYSLLKTTEIDLLITDIEMPNLSGYELADFVHTNALNIRIIFVTGYSAYAVHAFELNVLDYILKPYSKERLLKGIHRFNHINTEKLETDKMMLKYKSDIHMIEKQEIIFIERTGRSTTIVTKTGEFQTYQTLGELELKLKSKSFIRGHRGFIINIKYIKNFSLYTKQSYIVHFHHTEKTAMMTKVNVEQLQKNYY